MIIKKWNTTTTAWEEQYPKTLETMIYDSSSPTTTIFDGGKIKQAYLPDSVFGGMTFVGTVTYNTASTGGLDTLIVGGTSGWTLSSTLDAFTGKTYTNGDYADIGHRYVGHYWIVSGATTLDVSDGTANDEADFVAAALDDGVPKSAGAPYAIGAEPGDWLIITGWDNTNSTFLFNIVNNTYTAATTSSKGVVELATDAEVTTGTATNLIPSVKQLKDNYAPISHQHDETNIDMVNAYSSFGTAIGDTLEDVFLSLNSTIGSHSTSISTLEARKEVFVQASAPTANQNNDIWFDI